jgi:hypothetical protein
MADNEQLTQKGTEGLLASNTKVQPSVFDMLAGESPASAMDGWAE